jgi:uncharacterized peroxidase-related enzyme
MSFLGEVTEAQAEPRLREIYREMQEKFGFLPNYYKVLGRDLALAEGHQAVAQALMRDGALPLALKEQIGLVVSGLNTASYCIAAHMELLNKMGIERPLGRKLATNYEGAPVEEKTKVLFRFADRLTRRPGDIQESDIAALRAAGWSDDAIYEAVVAVAWFNFINRTSLGWGVVADF